MQIHKTIAYNFGKFASSPTWQNWKKNPLVLSWSWPNNNLIHYIIETGLAPRKIIFSKFLLLLYAIWKLLFMHLAFSNNQKLLYGILGLTYSCSSILGFSWAASQDNATPSHTPTSHAFSSGRMASEQTKSDLMSVEIINYENFNLVTCTITILILAMMIDCVHMISIKGYM